MPEKKRGFHALEERIHQIEEEHAKEEKQVSAQEPGKEKKEKKAGETTLES